MQIKLQIFVFSDSLGIAVPEFNMQGDLAQCFSNMYTITLGGLICSAAVVRSSCYLVVSVSVCDWTQS